MSLVDLAELRLYKKLGVLLSYELKVGMGYIRLAETELTSVSSVKIYSSASIAIKQVRSPLEFTKSLHLSK